MTKCQDLNLERGAAAKRTSYEGKKRRQNGHGREGTLQGQASHYQLRSSLRDGQSVRIIEGDQARIMCNERGQVVRAMPAAEPAQALHELELSLELTSAVCPHCGALNLFPGFSQILAFACEECGQGVSFRLGAD
jgi:hypothetical protein